MALWLHLGVHSSASALEESFLMSCSLILPSSLSCTKMGHGLPIPTSAWTWDPLKPCSISEVLACNSHSYSSVRHPSTVLRYYGKHHIGWTELRVLSPAGSHWCFRKQVSLLLRLPEAMPEEAAALPIPTSAWTPLGCWKEQPLHQNGQRGDNNCKSMKLVTQGVWAPSPTFKKVARVSVCSLWKRRSLACGFGPLCNSARLKTVPCFEKHGMYGESLAQQEKSTTHKGKEMHLLQLDPG